METKKVLHEVDKKCHFKGQFPNVYMKQFILNINKLYDIGDFGI